jgi:uncharacterized OB-fold protein
MTTKVPFREGLFEKVAGEWTLVGCRCKQCGKIYSFTIVHMPSEHFEPPYAVGWIELAEGIRIFSQIRGWQEQPLKIGMDMELSVEKLWDEEDKEITGYIFRPSVVKQRD